ncbi:PQQ-binding-like beta-propeller repeat protein [Mucisphaera sp.]|uniref:PQQ-binding-like beta-propeller repeat protein n=1 Tax=Mucisphaera sp. TaxID=2913024 RepID=UPI003D14E0C8
MRISTFGCLCLIALISLTGLAGCVSNDQSFEPPRRIGLIIDPSEAATVGYSVGWAQNLATPDGNQIIDAALLDDLILILEHPGNVVSALDASTGAVRWRSVIGLGEGRLFKPLRYEDRILINTVKSLYTISTDSGFVVDRIDLPHVVQSEPTLYGDLALFGAVNGRIYAHQIRAGFPAWEYGMSASISAPIAVTDNRVAVADDKGTSALLNADTGEVLWRRISYDRVSSRPIIANDFVAFASHDRSLYALDRHTGEDVWIFRGTRQLTRPAELLDGNLYLPVNEIGLFSIDPATGDTLWQIDTPATPIAVQNNRLLAYTETSILILDTEDGDTVAKAPTRRLAQVLMLNDQDLVLISPSGRVLRINEHN